MVALFGHIISSDVMLDSTRPCSCAYNAEQFFGYNTSVIKAGRTLA